MAANWGDVPTWFAAVGTFGSLVAGGVLLRQQGRQISELKRNDAKSQAKLVSAWPVSAARPNGGSSRVESVTVTIQNVSDEPVWECKIWVWSGNTQVPVDRKAFKYQIFVPKRQSDTEIVLNGEPHSGTDLPPVVLMFNDAAGLHWIRSANGKLMQIDVDACIAIEVWFSTDPPWPYELRCLKENKKTGIFAFDSAAHRAVKAKLSTAE